MHVFYVFHISGIKLLGTNLWPFGGDQSHVIYGLLYICYFYVMIDGCKKNFTLLFV